MKNNAPVSLSCPDCGAGNAIQIDLALPDGTQVKFCSCNACEHRWWNSEGKSLPLGDVLDLARAHQATGGRRRK